MPISREPDWTTGMIGSLLGYSIHESPNLRPGQVIRTYTDVWVRSTWDDLELPLMMAAMRTSMRTHLKSLVNAAELRLGLT